MKSINKITIAIISLLFYISCDTPQEQDYFKLKMTDAERLDLRGKVKCVKDSTFKVSLRFGELIKTSVKKGHVFEFDEQGRIIKDAPDSEHKYIETDSTLIHERYMNGELQTYTIISYNRNGDITKIGSHYSNGELFHLKVMTYRSDGLLKDISEYGSDGKLRDKKYDMQYDNNRCLIRYSHRYGELFNSISYTEITYDNKREIIGESTRYINAYDNSWWDSRDIEGGNTRTELENFTYDEHGNYVKSIKYHKELPIEMTIREIEYYE